MSDATLRAVPTAPRPMTVAELNRTVKGAVEERFPSVWVEGEIVQAKPSAGTGHVYFELKDEREEARLQCVMWKGNVQKCRARLAAGEKVQIKGRPGVYVPRGQYQFTADVAVPSGAGAAAAALAALKERLRAEGLFDAGRKRALPRFPRTIGVVTSASGAAFHDIVREAHRRWPARIVLSPTLVQGADAPAQIVRALAAVQRVTRLDVVIVGRGGGASEDLAAFNDERVARAIAACRVPVVSAVGHEVDHTLADLVADHRAATPTMAATLCTPMFTEECDRLEAFRQRLRRAMQLRVSTLTVTLQKRSPRDPRRRLHELQQRVDELSRRAEDAMRASLQRRAAQCQAAEHALGVNHPRARLAQERAQLDALAARLLPAMTRVDERCARRLDDLDQRLRRAVTRERDRRAQRLGLLAGKLDALSPVKILARGYGVVLHEGRAVIDAAQVSEGDVVTLRLHRGEVDARVERART